MTESESKFRLVAETNTDLFLIRSRGVEKIIYASRAYETLWERSLESLYESPRSFLEAIHPDDLDNYLQILDTNHIAGLPYQCEYRLIMSNMEVKWIRERGFPFAHGAKQDDVMTVVCTDFSAEKQREIDSKKIEEWNIAFMNAQPDLMFVLSRDGTFLDYHTVNQNILIFSPRQFLGKNIAELFSEKLSADFLALIEKTIDTATIQINEYALTIEDQKRYFESRYVALGENKVLAFIREISERKRVDEKLKQSQQELLNLTAHLQSVREEERRMIAREIHDEYGQQLTALKVELSWFGNNLPKSNKILTEKMGKMEFLVEELFKRSKELSYKLRPGFLDELGIVDALELYSEEFQALSGIACKLLIDEPELHLDRERGVVLFRIFQEALTNVSRHANATKVNARLETKNNLILFTIKDNGSGILEDKVNAPDSYGLIGMRERVNHFGGHIRIRGSRDRGTTITLELPFDGTS